MWRFLETITTNKKRKLLRDMITDAVDREWRSSLRVIRTYEEAATRKESAS